VNKLTLPRILIPGVVRNLKATHHENLMYEVRATDYAVFCFLGIPQRFPSAGGRVVVTSSAAHQLAQGGMNFNDLNYTTNSYKRWGAYGQSKLANVLMMRELDRRCHLIDGCGVTAYSFHPGVVDTELIRYHNHFKCLCYCEI
jgi:NAD(P)-dependent dehydrogenase (short-subunit alcohol dehydrogenase family)